MRFIADESCDFAVVRALREAGHDVAAMIELEPGAEVSAVIARALGERRVLLTEDKNSGSSCSLQHVPQQALSSFDFRQTHGAVWLRRSASL